MTTAIRPGRWRLIRLREVVADTEITDPTKQPDKPFQYVDVSGVSNESFCILEARQMEGNSAPSRARKLIRAADVIFATVRPALRRIALVPPYLDGQICSTGFCVLRPRPEKLDSCFLYQCLLTDAVSARVEAKQRGATYPAIADSDLLNLSILLPPLPEQRAIARVLRTVQECIQARRREVALAREHKAALMEQLFTHGTRGEPTKMTEIGEMPRSWEVVRLGDHARVRYGKAKRRQVQSGSVPVVGSGGVYDHTDSALVSVPTLVIGRKGTAGTVWCQEVPCWPSDTTYYLQWTSERLRYRYAYYRLLFRRLSGQHARTTLPSLQRPDVESYVLPLASVSEQEEIVGALTLCDTSIGAFDRETALLEELFRALLEELMSGRLSAFPLAEREPRPCPAAA